MSDTKCTYVSKVILCPSIKWTSENILQIHLKVQYEESQEEIKTQNFYIYDINEVIIQSQTYLFFQ